MPTKNFRQDRTVEQTCRCCTRVYSAYAKNVEQGKDKGYCALCNLSGCRIDDPHCGNGTFVRATDNNSV